LDVCSVYTVEERNFGGFIPQIVGEY